MDSLSAVGGRRRRCGRRRAAIALRHLQSIHCERVLCSSVARRVTLHPGQRLRGPQTCPPSGDVLPGIQFQGARRWIPSPAYPFAWTSSQPRACACCCNVWPAFIVASRMDTLRGLPRGGWVGWVGSSKQSYSKGAQVFQPG